MVSHNNNNSQEIFIDAIKSKLKTKKDIGKFFASQSKYLIFI